MRSELRIVLVALTLVGSPRVHAGPSPLTCLWVAGDFLVRGIDPSLLESPPLPAEQQHSTVSSSQAETSRQRHPEIGPDAVAAPRGVTDAALDALEGVPQFPDLPPLPRPCEPRTSLEFPCRPVYVSSLARPFSGPADGTPKRPFSTIGRALEAVDDLKECLPEIRIGRGEYHEDLELSFDIVLRARKRHDPVLVGSITIADPVNVAISGLSFVDSDGPAAVAVLNRCASLRLEDVRIDRASRFGVRQSGGQLVMTRTQVLRTRRLGGNNANGTAVLIERGARAALSGLLLLENEGPALLIQGAGTEVLADAALIAENHVRRLVDDPPCGTVDAIAAVEVRRDARLEMERCYLIRNELVSLLATTGGSIRFRRGLIRETLAPEWSTSRCHGGIGASAGSGGRIRLNDFRVSRNDLCGLQVLEGGELDASDGVIDGNPIGTSVQREGYDLARVADSVAYVDNDRNIDATFLPIPDPALP